MPAIGEIKRGIEQKTIDTVEEFLAAGRKQVLTQCSLTEIAAELERRKLVSHQVYNVSFGVDLDLPDEQIIVEISERK